MEEEWKRVVRGCGEGEAGSCREGRKEGEERVHMWRRNEREVVRKNSERGTGKIVEEEWKGAVRKAREEEEKECGGYITSVGVEEGKKA